MYVKVDERAAALRACLPGANCGACGFSGCDGYAAALLAGEAAANLCPPGGSGAAKQIGEILGAEGGDVAKLIAAVRCCGDNDTRSGKMEYGGIQTCAAAKLMFGGHYSCTFGCVGYGDCAAVCPTGAICMENGLARIDTRRCTGCGLCVKGCPNGVITAMEDLRAVAVLCRNTEKGAKVKDKCSRGCIGCMKCAKECPAGAMEVKDFLAGIDYEKCTGCGKCAEVCVKKCIRLRSAGS
jgi:Na+-translocating ferredoxin:NAD+ oxidoreductase RNF subunit RnfB